MKWTHLVFYKAKASPKAKRFYTDMPRKKNWLSIRPVNDCIFSRRNGFTGKVIWGYSICLRIFGIDLI